MFLDFFSLCFYSWPLLFLSDIAHCMVRMKSKQHDKKISLFNELAFIYRDPMIYNYIPLMLAPDYSGVPK